MRKCRNRCGFWWPGLVLCLCVPSVLSAQEDARPCYQSRKVQGFTIYIHPQAQEHADELKAALQELEQQFDKITAVVPERHLARLRQVPIWMEWEKKKNGAAEYHNSKAWLRSHGYPEKKVNSIEINNLRNFVRWSQQAQPWMLLHELAHAFHFQVLGAEHAGIIDAFRQAKERKLYDSVKHVRGQSRKAYALTNAFEYFAELSEAYFGRNDFYPFNREELQKHDPAGYRVLAEVWGD